MSRRCEFPARIKAAAFHRAKGACEGCRAKLSVGKFHFDHNNPDGLTGEPTLSNCVVLCVPCHREKTTKIDIPTIAKAKRREAKFIGAKAPSRRGFRGWRRFDGTVVWRERRHD